MAPSTDSRRARSLARGRLRRPRRQLFATPSPYWAGIVPTSTAARTALKPVLESTPVAAACWPLAARSTRASIRSPLCWSSLQMGCAAFSGEGPSSRPACECLAARRLTSALPAPALHRPLHMFGYISCYLVLYPMCIGDRAFCTLNKTATPLA